jgi:hypothetical protein
MQYSFGHSAPGRRCNLHIPRKVAPSGLPTCLSLWLGSAFEANNSNIESPEVSTCSPACNEVLSLNSCVTATPMLANANEVRSQAKKVRSGLVSAQHFVEYKMNSRMPYPMQDGRELHCPCSPIPSSRTCLPSASTTFPGLPLCPVVYRYLVYHRYLRFRCGSGS